MQTQIRQIRIGIPHGSSDPRVLYTDKFTDEELHDIALLIQSYITPKSEQ